MKVEEILEYCGRWPSSTLTSIGSDGTSITVTFAELQATGMSLADRLGASGLGPGHVIGLQAENAIDWIVWDLAVAHLGAALRPYPLHHTLDPAEIVAAHRLALLVSDNPSHVESARVTPLSPALFVPSALDAPRSDWPDLHSIVYSSGTTGREKVLLISRAGASAAFGWFCSAFPIGPDDRHLIFLPLTGLQQRQQVYACLSAGANLVLCHPQRAMSAMKLVKPTFLLAPPGLYENMLSIAASSGSPLAELFGGETRFLITGMAPIRRSVMEAYWAAGLKLFEGYGLTECGIIACNTQENCKLGTVGRPIDPGALSISAEGEILVRRPYPLSLGYLDDPDLNASVFDPDGTVRTGDTGRIDDDGFLILDGRIKDVIVLENGKKLHPRDLEDALLQVPGVEDAVAIDNGRGVTVVLNISDQASQKEVGAAVRGVARTLEAAAAINQVIFADIPLSRNPIFNTANMKLNRPLIARYFLGRTDGDAVGD